jgi:energy-coupling factor transporter transmembrane protein EcfT
MGIEDKNNDVFFKRLFNDKGIEKAPDGFADRVMQSIGVEEKADTSERWSWSGWWLWGSIFLALAALVTMVFFVDFSFMGNIFTGLTFDETMLSRVSEEIGRELLGIQEGFSISPLTVTIVFAIIVLIVADRIFRRRPKTQMNIV